MLSIQPQAPVLRLVPPPSAGAPEPAVVPAPEILNEMEAKVREWLHSDHLVGCDSLKGACWEVLNRVNDFLLPYISEASDGVREFLRMVREAEPGDHAGLHVVHPVDPAAAIDDEEEDELGWGAREFLRLAEVAQKVTPLSPRR
jgi:hypothetical protein